MDVAKVIHRQGIEPFETARGEREAVHRSARTEEGNARSNAVLLTVDGNLALALQAMVHFGMDMRIKHEVGSLRHHGDAAYKAVCGPVSARDEGPKPDRITDLIVPSFVLQGVFIEPFLSRHGTLCDLAGSNPCAGPKAGSMGSRIHLQNLTVRTRSLCLSIVSETQYLDFVMGRILRPRMVLKQYRAALD